ncbi:MAG: FAD-dependent oxidoreductase [Actinomyces sp.]|nr:FAD-dependent oxidoreductase [Actinomyces sp.]MCI1663165.1 FAD-dependent oxidoreductase [Actinomyces sp.]MCI1692054.1 FAD-dependent oxidoreductase [Actinomyces sp.]
MEANDRVGGKTYSPKLRGKSIETGAIMGMPNYDTVKELGAAAGVPEGGPESQAHTDFRRPDGKLYRPFTGLNLWKGARLMYQLNKLDRILKSRYPGYDANGHYGTFYPDLALPLSKFFEKNGVAALTDLYAQPFISPGYGYFEGVLARSVTAAASRGRPGRAR